MSLKVRGQAAQLVLGVGVVEPAVQPVGGDLGRRGGHPIDGRQGLAGQPVSAAEGAGQGQRAGREQAPPPAPAARGRWAPGETATWTTSGPDGPRTSRLASARCTGAEPSRVTLE